MWTSNNPSILHLIYRNEYDTSFSEKDIDIELINLIKGIASDLGIRSKFETSNLNIYGYDPNKSYSIISAKRSARDIYESKLITDGDILDISNHEFEPHMFYPDPTGRTEAQKYKECIYRVVSLKNASYAISQGTYNDELRKIEVFSTITEADKLEKISKLAKQSQMDDGVLLTEDKPYVRKLSLF